MVTETNILQIKHMEVHCNRLWACSVTGGQEEKQSVCLWSFGQPMSIASTAKTMVHEASQARHCSIIQPYRPADEEWVLTARTASDWQLYQLMLKHNNDNNTKQILVEKCEVCNFRLENIVFIKLILHIYTLCKILSKIVGTFCFRNVQNFTAIILQFFADTSLLYYSNYGVCWVEQVWNPSIVYMYCAFLGYNKRSKKSRPMLSH